MRVVPRDDAGHRHADALGPDFSGVDVARSDRFHVIVADYTSLAARDEMVDDRLDLLLELREVAADEGRRADRLPPCEGDDRLVADRLLPLRMAVHPGWLAFACDLPAVSLPRVLTSLPGGRV